MSHLPHRSAGGDRFKKSLQNFRNAGPVQSEGMGMASLIDRILAHAAHVAKLTYGLVDGGHRFTVNPIHPPLTEQRGVYFLLSHSDTQIQKIGLANGKGGLRQRMRGYE